MCGELSADTLVMTVETSSDAHSESCLNRSPCLTICTMRAFFDSESSVRDSESCFRSSFCLCTTQTIRIEPFAPFLLKSSSENVIGRVTSRLAGLISPGVMSDVSGEDLTEVLDERLERLPDGKSKDVGGDWCTLRLFACAGPLRAFPLVRFPLGSGEVA